MNPKKPRKRIKVNVGDVFAVPLNEVELVFGYLRTYQDPDVAILPFISKGRMLRDCELPTLKSFMDVLTIRTGIERGDWTRIASFPFPNEESTWAPPRRQLSTIRPDVRLVVVKGNFVPAEKYGEWDTLPVLIKADTDQLKALILTSAAEFQILT
ncbi:hypothetical protein U0039_15670 [Stenotrophomonas maltophilia]|uniref:hypothetical protein n=1 Tax=Stenotrophomonas maltophilia TaxID=40324 RepID=UPI0011811572|nr:hypothetical protein [Stenotrophomonas maltophilia]QQA81199.1 hypothetical protein I6I01_14255 [Stenotrophomonas maltophilia]WQE22359.1 hypothetical protein U0039_15670 [Stenotrophomonas maltophilia]HDS1016384.1 hypothetical protein [Stenotrophomonas maltophilia]HEL4806164.1 hypothetical protein [Stenotrophomonas maltophilia]